MRVDSIGRRALVALAAGAALVATACGSSSTSSTGGGGTGSSSAPSFNGTLKFGVLVSLSGPSANIGTDQKTGLEMAASEVNASGGILGQQVVLDAQDDGSTATTAVQGAHKLVDQDGIQALFGPTLSAPTLAVVPVTKPAGIIEMGTAVAPDAADASKYPQFFRMSPPAALQAATFVSFMQQKGFKNAALLAVNNTLGTSNIDAFKAAIQGTGITIAGTQVNDSGAVDLTSQEQKLKDGNPDVLLVLETANPDQIAAVKARNALNWSVPVLGFSTMHDPAIAQAVGQQGMSNVFAGQSYVRLTEGNAPTATTDWLTRLRKYLNTGKLTHDVSQIAVGYDALSMFANAANATKSTDFNTLRSYLEQNPYSGVANLYKYDAARHDGITLSDVTFVVAAYFNDGLYKTS